MAKNYEQMTRSELLAEVRRLAAANPPDFAVKVLRHDLSVHQEELQAQHRQLQETQSLLEASRDAYAELYDFAPFPYLTLDVNGLIKSINLTGCSLLELERGRLLESPFTMFADDATRGEFLNHMRCCRQGNGGVASEIVLRTRSKKLIPVLLTSRGAGDGTFRTAIIDLSERKHAEHVIKELNASLEKRVEERTAELRLSNEALHREIEQRQQVETALQEAHRRKDEFLAMLGHELRNPLGPISNAAELLRMLSADLPELEQVADIVERQSRHMARIVDDLLDVSRISRGKITLRMEVVDLAKIVRDVVEDISSEVTAANLLLEFDLPRDEAWVNGDTTRLAQIAGNLLHNALKFTNRGGKVTVGVRTNREQRMSELFVRDTGIGIDAEMLPRVFEVFSQADSSLDRSRGGLGLGLALVRGLVKMHGGEIGVHSAGLGQGAEFLVRLPSARPPAQTDQPHMPAENGNRVRVLLIDDQRDTVVTMRSLIASLGHEVYTAMDGEEGIEVARRTRPDVIFSDIGLPGMDGYMVARSVRQDPAVRSTYLVAITGYGKPEDRHRAFEAGFDRHLTKPIPFQEIKGLLASLR